MNPTPALKTPSWNLKPKPVRSKASVSKPGVPKPTPAESNPKSNGEVESTRPHPSVWRVTKPPSAAEEAKIVDAQPMFVPTTEKELLNKLATGGVQVNKHLGCWIIFYKSPVEIRWSLCTGLPWVRTCTHPTELLSIQLIFTNNGTEDYQRARVPWHTEPRAGAVSERNRPHAVRLPAPTGERIKPVR